MSTNNEAEEILTYLESNDSEVVKQFKNIVQENLYSSHDHNLLDTLVDQYVHTRSDRLIELLVGVSEAHSIVSGDFFFIVYCWRICGVFNGLPGPLGVNGPVGWGQKRKSPKIIKNAMVIESNMSLLRNIKLNLTYIYILYILLQTVPFMTPLKDVLYWK